MRSTIKTFEIQIDEKPNGYVIRLNDKDKCILRICKIPKALIESGGFVDVVYQDKNSKNENKEEKED